MGALKKIGLTTILLTAALLGSKHAEAQWDYRPPFAAGIRACPDGGGANLRYFAIDNLSAEVQYNISGGTKGGSGKSSMIGLLVQFHRSLTSNLSFFIGAGAHSGTWQRYKDISKTTSVFGFDAIIGVEYIFPSVPIGISIDAKPSFNYVTGVTLFPNNTFGLGVRYYFDIAALYGTEKADKRE
jgi:hypothetical protein